ncbi:mucin-5AC-like [Pollicipes pollicipes]|uniref:mucin-5AC-like n=1 Tax=Pollicipes pollicipes TaxID=41117 RepID=UPI001884D3F9|nr:mucin-5AC-like [Pollicipes pollicipes]
MTAVTSLLALAAVATAAVAPLPSDQDTPREWLTLLPTNISFSCAGRVPGYYADVDSGCQMYHMCDPQSKRYSYLCPALTEFNQFYMTCVQHERVNCSMSEKFYHMNEMIGKPRMRFHSLHHDDHKKKDTEGSKADNQVDVSAPAGEVLFEFETKLDMPLPKLRPRLRPRQRLTTKAAASSLSPTTTPAPRRVQSHRRAGASSARRRRPTNATTPAPATGSATVSNAAGAKASTAAPSAGRIAAPPTGRAASPSTVGGRGEPAKPTAPTSAPTRRALFTTLTRASAGTVTTPAPRRTTARTNAPPRRRQPAAAATTAVPTTRSPPVFGEKTRSRLRGTERPKAPAVGAIGAVTVTERPGPRAKTGDRPRVSGGEAHKTRGGSLRMKPRLRLSDIIPANRTSSSAADIAAEAVSAVEKTLSPPSALSAALAAFERRDPALPRNTFQTFGLPGSFVFGIEMDEGRPVAVLPPKPRTAKAAPSTTTPRPTTASPTTTRRTTAKTARTVRTRTTTPKSVTARSTVGRITTEATRPPRPPTTRSAPRRTTLPPATAGKATTRQTPPPTTPRPAVTRRTTERGKAEAAASTARARVIPRPSAGSRRATTAKPARLARRRRPPAKQLPAPDELEALKLSFTIEPPQFALREDGPHEERKMKVRGELITGEMALRKMMVDQLKPVYFPSLKVPLNLLPPLLSEHHEPDGGMISTLTLPVRRSRTNDLLATGGVESLLPPDLGQLVSPGGTTPATSTQSSASTPASSTQATSTSATSQRPPSSRRTVTPKEDPPGLTMKFEKTKKKGFKVGDSHGSKEEVCYPCMKSFIKDLDNCHPCVVIR